MFFFKQKTAYEMRISDWSSDVCSSDLLARARLEGRGERPAVEGVRAMEWLGLLNYAVFMAIFIGIFAILALGLNIQLGLPGLFYAVVAGFFAVGAYTSAILTGTWLAGRLCGFVHPVSACLTGAFEIGSAPVCTPFTYSH